MHISPQEFINILQKTSLTLQEQESVVAMLDGMTMDEIKALYKILLEDAKNTEKILTTLDSENQKTILKLQNDIQAKS